MSVGATLEGFAYGEHLEGPQKRSLGFRLLVPESPQSWSGEVETLARQLQAAPYPDHWPTTDLFCSVLLANGQRLVALARYGLEDRTPSRRRGGMELIGIVTTNSLSVSSALAIYQWLRQRRTATEEIRLIAGQFDLVEVLAEAPSPPVMSDPVPVLPIRLWQDGALLFAASAPSDPDLRLGMLEHSVDAKWQWLPLTGPDFPISQYAQRGPVIAWTPHLTGLAVKLDQNAAGQPVSPSAPKGNTLVKLLLLIALALLAGNIWMTWRLQQQWNEKNLIAEVKVEPEKKGETEKKETDSRGDLDAFAQQLYRYLLERGTLKELREGQLLQQYEKLSRKNDAFSVKSTEAKLALGAMVEMAGRKSPAQIEALIRATNQNGKGLDSEVIQFIAQRVYAKLTEEP